MPGPDGETPPEQTVAPGADEVHDVPADAPHDDDAPLKPGPGFLERLPWYTVPAILLGVPLLAWLLAQVYTPFYENVIWQYYWGPIKADALSVGNSGLCLDGTRGPCSQGPPAFSGYNIVNTVSWAVLLGTCIVGLAQMLQRFRTVMDNTLILGAAAWVLPGSLFHVMQDAGLFDQPLEYFFITPPIYLLFAAGGVVSFLVGIYVQAVARQRGLEVGLKKLWFILVIAVLGYTLLWAMPWQQVTYYINPVWMALFAAAVFLVMRWRFVTTERIQPAEVVVIASFLPLLASLVWVAAFIQQSWASGLGAGAMPSAIILVPAAAFAVTGAVYGVARLRNNIRPTDANVAFLRPMNLVLIFSQMVDAFSTAFGVDLRGYTEKHILSGKVIHGFEWLADTTGFEAGVTYSTFLSFVPLKFLVSIAVVYAIDVYSKEDVKQYPTLIGLVKFAIIMVGIGPGLRNTVRLSLGV